jgi:type IV secretory pathway VirB4 component
MMSVPRILRDYCDAGSVNSLLAIWGFIDEHAFLTKAGHVGLVYRVMGSDYECLDQMQRRDIVHRFEAALRLLDDSCRVYQYLCKRRIGPIAAAPCAQRLAHQAIQRRAEYLNTRRGKLYEIDLYVVLVYEGLRPDFPTSTQLRGLIGEPRPARVALVERRSSRAGT